MHVEIKSLNIPYQFTAPNGEVLFKIEEVTLVHETFSGILTSEIKRINFERGDGVGVLLYIQETDEVVLIEQFRYPVFANPNNQTNKGWLLEIVAGIKDDTGLKVARREIFEETGLELNQPLEHLVTFYVSPGGTSEKIELYLAQIKKADGIQTHTGLESESEDIRTHIIPRAQAIDLLENGTLQDAKTMIALMMLEKRLSTS